VEKDIFVTIKRQATKEFARSVFTKILITRKDGIVIGL
jgi:hypothetical protein